MLNEEEIFEIIRRLPATSPLIKEESIILPKPKVIRKVRNSKTGCLEEVEENKVLEVQEKLEKENYVIKINC